MTYEVIRAFTDLQDNNHFYAVGDTYPRNGYNPTESRYAELSGDGNKQGTPLIKAPEKPAKAVIDDVVERKTRRNRKK